MTYFRFSWSALVTEAALSQITDGMVPTDAERSEIAELIAHILDAVVGIPISQKVLAGTECTEFTLNVLHNAVLHTLSAERETPIPGFTTDETTEPVTVRAATRVALNSASVETIANLPEIGNAVARKIVETRRMSPLTGLDDLDARVRGIGSVTTKRIAKLVSFNMPRIRPAFRPTGSLAQALAFLSVAHTDALPAQGLIRTLERIVMAARRHRSPGAHPLLDAAMQASVDAVTFQVHETQLLSGSVYYQRLPSVFDAAQHSIDLCMFHIAMPAENHPTRLLLDRLVAAVARGVTIRVLTDQDRPEDPYQSNPINAAAIQYLRAANVLVRRDAAEVLLHSKFTIIDRARMLIGSHNWSAGSFFHFDDVTLMFTSPELALAQTERFEQLWSRAQA